MFKSLIKQVAPSFGLRWLHHAGLYKNYKPAVGKVYAADLDRLTPLSTEFGYNRGGPVDRYYIENFLAQESGSIRGRVLEIGDNEYTLKYGGDAVIKSDILHVNENNPHATFIGDLTNAAHIPDAIFDCIILTQTLHLIYDYRAALQTCHRILKPGGVLLLTSPGITPIDHGEWKKTWYWSFTDKAIQKMSAAAFPKGDVAIEVWGNVYVATAFLYGLGLQEIPKEKLDFRDPHFQVIVTAKIKKEATV